LTAARGKRFVPKDRLYYGIGLRKMENYQANADEPLVSIGIPVYNGENFLAEALDSALSQEYGNLEIVICDNASTDGTADICRAYASADTRVRYFRSAVNLGAVRNFGQTVLRSTGEYFTWLAHDDLLIGNYGVRRLVSFMQQNPDVVLCGSGINAIDYIDPTVVTPKYFAEIHPDRDWLQSRLEFFSWPQSECYFVVYGLYRRVDLARISFTPRIYRGQEAVLDMEFAILLRLLRYGRIVAIPEILRAIRLHAQAGSVIYRRGLSQLDKFLLGLHTKWFVLLQALLLRVPIREKVALLKRAVRNFFVANFRRPTDDGDLLAAQRRELTLLYRTCDDRLRLIQEQQARMEMLERIAQERLLEMEEKDRALARLRSDLQNAVETIVRHHHAEIPDASEGKTGRDGD